MIIAIQKSNKDQITTPANWEPGDDVIIPPPRTVVQQKNALNQKKMVNIV